MSQNKKLTKKEIKTLKNALGKQGITMEEHEIAQKSTKPCEILQIDCFTIGDKDKLLLSDGWYIGYAVEYNGVGMEAGGGLRTPPGEPEESDSSDESQEDVDAEDSDEDEEDTENETSGFDSDPPSDAEGAEGAEVAPQVRNHLRRRDSDEDSDKGQLLYGLDENFYVDKGRMTAVSTTLYDRAIKKTFKTGDLITTERFVTEKSNRYELHRGYQLIGDDDIPCVMTEDSEEEEEDRSSEPDYTAHSGLWCNFVIAPIELQDIETRRKAKIAEEKSSTIPLDKDKIAQISAAMANIKLPTPPGWEGISDSKILEFVRDKM